MTRLTVGTVGIAVAFLATTFGALESVQAQEAALEEIVVTGSNIRRTADYDNPNPAQTGELTV